MTTAAAPIVNPTSVECPRCLSGVRTECMTRNGNVTWAHKVRWEAANAASAAWQEAIAR